MYLRVILLELVLTQSQNQVQTNLGVPIMTIAPMRINKEKKKQKINIENINDQDWSKLHSSMIGVIDSPIGTAKRLQKLKKFKVAAKSGTVELVSTDTKEDYKIIRKNEGNRDHAIIIAFGPMPNPKYAVSVVIENGESGGSVAGPVAIAVLNNLLEK